ncbi:signal recognition particle-docking protein FtsY [Intestinibacter sp.]|uniref:signal recognition particle-docking protein FtsY n=1 Tax=Intestinibacter sp. TaxID=1965304 RepID=UPI0018ABB877|nr:signal recognition particle-docking protein FtsY [Clostridium sp. 1001270J_160509_D11]
MFKKLFGFGKKKKEEIQEESVEEIQVEEDDNSELEEAQNDSDDLKEEIEEQAEDIEVQSADEDEISTEYEKQEEIINEKSQDEEKAVDVVAEEKELETSDEEIEEIKEELAQEIEESEEVEEAEEAQQSQEIEEDIEQEDEFVEEIEETETIEEKPKKVSLFDRLKQGLTKAKQGITDRVDEVLKAYTKVDEELLEDLEEVLITADVGVNTTMDIIKKLEDAIRRKKITDPQDVREELKLIIEDILSKDDTKLDASHSPTIILMVGVNGVGKTTTIGKLAHRYKSEGKKVLLAAGDTFRAAAIDQLEVWANRCNVDIIKHQEGADPGAVIFDAIKASKSRGVDVLICDTAGRLHNKSNLMNELGKVFKIVDREYPEAKKEVLLVVDATTGQNAVSQAKSFKEVCDITGLVLTKLDGTAKGGVVLAVKSEVDVPVKLIGVGEQMEDLQDFDSKSFVDALFG